MTNLSELMSIEEKLLKFEESDKFLMDFNEYIKLEKFLDEIGYITDKYFSLLKEYDEKLTKQDLSLDVMSRMIENFIEKSLNSNIEYNTDDVKTFMLKNNIK